MRRPLAPSTSLTAVSAATTPSSPGLNSATSKLSVGGAGLRPPHLIPSPLRPPVAIRGWRYTPVAPTARYLRCGCGALDHPQLPARLFRHALWGPDRFVDDVDAGVGESRQGHRGGAGGRHTA